MAVIDRLTSSSHLEECFKTLEGLSIFLRHKKNEEDDEKFKQQMKESMKGIVQNLKPKKFLYAFPVYLTENEWGISGWQNSETLKADHIQKSQTFEPTVNKSCGKLTIEGNATTTKKCMEIKKFREISLDQFVKV